jgi:hypothetical protein
MDMKQIQPIEALIIALNYQMQNMSNKESSTYQTIKACKELAEDILKEYSKNK